MLANTGPERQKLLLGKQRAQQACRQPYVQIPTSGRMLASATQQAPTRPRFCPYLCWNVRMVCKQAAQAFPPKLDRNAALRHADHTVNSGSRRFSKVGRIGPDISKAINPRGRDFTKIGCAAAAMGEACMQSVIAV
eukprot:359260-Chlamydomonas_euryale.AAC.5